MKNLIILLVTLFSGTAFGNVVSKYSCSNVGGTAEWTIYVDLEKKLAGFFDNDSTVTVPLVDIYLLKTNPPQWEYIFQGKDDNGGKNAKLRISFNQTRMEAYASFITKKGTDTKKAEDGCVADTHIDL
jgi:hypothetical protein